MRQKIQVKVALIGGGPACASAAIQLMRSRVDILLISKDIGGTIRNANLIENLLGFPAGISGEDYILLLKEQLRRNDVPTLLEEVLSINGTNSSQYLISTSKTEILTDFIVIGTGTVPKKLNIEGEELAFNQKRLFYEIWNAKPLSQGKNITIIGSGDVAYDYALNLYKNAHSITIVQRSVKTKSLQILQERLSQKKNICVLKETAPIKIVNNKKNSITLVVKSSNKTTSITSDFILVAIGRKPTIDYLSPQLKEEYSNPSPSSNLYFIGDVKNGNYRQVSIAMGDGVKAAMEIVKKMKERDSNSIQEREQDNGTPRQIW
ncbi:MAG: NAD(P)/FAD-dependent oxidoreductase [Promethearchaeota archaeon]